MGNNSTRLPLSEDTTNFKYLNLSRKLMPEDYVKHRRGECLEGSLQSIPSEIIYYDTISLYEEIDFSFNFISYVPEEFSLRVPHLQVLNVSHNQLTGLPSSFHLLLHLTVLDLSYNKFEVVPDSLVKLAKLNKLNISHNLLKDLPNSVSSLKQMTKLSVSYNCLRVLPESILECSSLQTLVTLGNSLIHPPQAICDQGTSFILDHLSKSRTSSCSKLVPQVSVALPGVFVRIRGQQVMASVTNPDSASREYKQAQGTARTNKRKCPLMLPEAATLLAPDQLKEAIVGLIYGACIGDALALNTEELTKDECLFYYDMDALCLKDRIQDLLRSHYPPNDWSANSDVMLLTLDSMMRWGGVVDELELVSEILQWKIHGHNEIDPFPGHPLSKLTQKVIEAEGYSGHPHSAAESLFKKMKSEQARGLSHDVNTNDNSCLPAALIVGIPNFHKEVEVAMNAERICKASHGSPIASSCCIFISLLVAALLQGKFRDKTDYKMVLEELKEKTLSYFSDAKLNSDFDRMFAFDRISMWDSDDIRRTVQYVVMTLNGVSSRGFESSLSELIMRGGRGIAAHCCVIGGILGAHFGYSGLPLNWLKELPKENLTWLNAKVNQLLDLFGLP